MEQFEKDSRSGRLLIVDDDELVLRSMRRALVRSGFEVEVAESGTEALAAVDGPPFDVAILDLALPDASGFDVLRSIKARDPAIQCIIFTGHTSAPTALEAYDAGAVEFFEKPITDWQRFLEVVQRAVALHRASVERAAEAEPDDDDSAIRSAFTGSSRAVTDLRREIARARRRAGPVLVYGPGGSGRTRVAELLASNGAGAECIVVDASSVNAAGVRGLCGAVEHGEVMTGLLDTAQGGVLVLRDIESLAFDLQEVLASILHRGAWRRLGDEEPLALRARLVALASESPERLRESSAVRGVLLARFDVRVRVPGLDERVEDIPQIVYHYVRQANAAHGLDIRRVPHEVMQRLLNHDWRQAQVRGLGAAVVTAALASRGDVLEQAALPAVLHDRAAVVPMEGVPSKLPERYRGLSYIEFKERLLGDWMALYVLDLLDITGGNVTRAAKLADLHRPNFRRLMKRYGIDVSEGSDTSED